MTEVDDKLVHEKLAVNLLKRIWQNNDLFLNIVVDEKEINIYYYYDDIESFYCNKEITFLIKFFKMVKFDKRKWLIHPTVGIFHTSFHYSDLICNKKFNFVTWFDIKKLQFNILDSTFDETSTLWHINNNIYMTYGI